MNSCLCEHSYINKGECLREIYNWNNVRVRMYCTTYNTDFMIKTCGTWVPTDGNNEPIVYHMKHILKINFLNNISLYEEL